MSYHMDFNNWNKCLNGTSTAWALLLLQALELEVRRSSLERSKHGRSDNGAVSQVEDTASPNDDNDVDISVESSGVVHVTSRSNKRTSRSSECSHGGHDRCICGMVESRKGIV